MQARCPHCTSVFATDRTGVQFCPSCGRQINVPDARTPTASTAPPAPEAPGTPGPGYGSSPGGAGGPGAGYGGTAGGYGAGAAGGYGAGYGASGQGGTFGGAGGPPSGFGGGGGAGGEFRPEPTEWERRKELGFFAGWFGTLKRSSFSPDPFWRTVDPAGSMGDALLYYWLNMTVYFVLALPLTYLQFKLQMDMAGASGTDPDVERMMAMISGPVLVGIFVGMILLLPVGFFIYAGIQHVCLLLVGGGKQGFGATARAFGYGSGPNVIGWVPCLGGVVGGIYSAVLTVWGMARIHRTDVWRAVVAYLLPLFIAMCCGCGLVFAAMSAGGIK